MTGPSRNICILYCNCLHCKLLSVYHFTLYTLHLPSVTSAFLTIRRQRFKKTIKLIVEVVELVLELSRLGEEEQE
jgi:hypothetical protein